MSKYGRYFVALFIISLAVINSYGGKIPFLLFYILSTVIVLSVVQIVYIAMTIKINCNFAHTAIIKGETIPLEIKVINDTRFYYHHLQVYIDYSEDIDIFGLDVGPISVTPKSEKEIPVSIECNYRGEYELILYYVEIFDFFHLFSWKKKLNQTHTIIVYPKVSSIPSLGINESPEDSGVETALINKKDGNTVSDLRSYVAGDSMNRIHWKVSARTGDLYTKNFETTVEAKNVIVVDLSTIDDIELEDKIVEIGVSIAYYSLQRNMGVKVLYVEQGVAMSYAENIHEFYNIYSLFATVKFAYDYGVEIPLRHYLEEASVNTNLWVITTKLSDLVIEQLNVAQTANNQSALVLVSKNNDGKNFDCSSLMSTVYRISCNDNLEEMFR